MTFEAREDDFIIGDDAAKLDIVFIHKFLSEESYWAKNIPFNVVEKSVRNSMSFGLYSSKEQIGFARLITDRATFAYLADVFIIEAYRGRGLAKWFIQTIQKHPELQGLRRWMLATRDAHDLYKKLGWVPLTNTDRYMQIHNPDVYL